MKHAPRLELEPRPSRIAIGFVAVSCGATVVLALVLSIPWWVKLVLVGAVGFAGVRAIGRSAGAGLPARVTVADNRRLTLLARNGRALEGEILDASYVGALFATIVWRTDNAPWWRPAGAIVMLPDMVGAGAFRRLRVLLRYGVPDPLAERKGVDAG